MSNWQVPSATRSEVLGADAGAGVVATSGNAVKGAWFTLGTASFRYDAVAISLTPGTSTLRYRFDIGYTLNGADVVVAEDVYIDFAGSANMNERYLLPIRIPAGAVVKFRALSTSTASLGMVLTGFGLDGVSSPAGQRIVSCTDFTSSLPTNTVIQTGLAWTAWTTIRAVTPARIRHLFATVIGAGDNTRTAGTMVVQIGVGAAGSEQVIGALLIKQATSALFAANTSLLCDIPAGARLSFRVMGSASGMADTVGVACSGLAA